MYFKGVLGTNVAVAMAAPAVATGGADSLMKLKPFWRNVWQNSFFWLCHMDKRVKYS
jgi:hypothetical protein